MSFPETVRSSAPISMRPGLPRSRGKRSQSAPLRTTWSAWAKRKRPSCPESTPVSARSRRRRKAFRFSLMRGRRPSRRNSRGLPASMRIRTGKPRRCLSATEASWQMKRPCWTGISTTRLSACVPFPMKSFPMPLPERAIARRSSIPRRRRSMRSSLPQWMRSWRRKRALKLISNPGRVPLRRS